LSGKESQIKESQMKERNTDLEYPPAHRKNRDALADVGGGRPSEEIKQYPALREALRQYLGERPSDRVVADIKEAGMGAPEAHIVGWLRQLYSERGLKPGTRHGPRSWAWFKTAVAGEAAKWAARNEVTGCGTDPGAFDRMTAAIEVTGRGLRMATPR
jgi:hypothetical protein